MHLRIGPMDRLGHDIRRVRHGSGKTLRVAASDRQRLYLGMQPVLAHALAWPGAARWRPIADLYFEYTSPLCS